MDRSRVLAVGDVSLFLRELGPASAPSPPLVVIHGGPDWDHSYLMPGLAAVAEHLHVVLFDMRGCGRSSRSLGAEAYQPEYVVEDVARLIDVLGYDRVDLLGFSTGGQVAQLFTEAHPQRLRRLILASTTAYPDTQQYLVGWQEYQRRMLVEIRAGIEEGVDEHPIDGSQFTRRGALAAAPTAIWDLDRLDDYLGLLAETRFSGDWLEPFQAGRLHPWRPCHPEQVLRALDKPILLLHGGQDMVFPVQLAQRLRQAVPSTQLVVIDDAGHMVQFEQPHKWARAVVDFLT